MSKRSFRTALAVVIGSLVIIGAIVVYLIVQALSYPKEAHAGTGKDIEVEIKTGMSFPSVASTLADRNVISKPTWFRLYAM